LKNEVLSLGLRVIRVLHLCEVLYGTTCYRSILCERMKGMNCEIQMPPQNYFFVVLGMEHRVLHMLCECCTTELHPSP
jgi:hypothetical protein